MITSPTEREKALETRRQIRATKGWDKSDEETLYCWFHDLYQRDFDHDETGHFHGKDSRDGTLVGAIRCAMKGRL